jgi:hypothetical protein
MIIRSMVFTQLIDDCPDNHMKHKNILCRKSAESLILKQKVHRAMAAFAWDDSDA